MRSWSCTWSCWRCGQSCWPRHARSRQTWWRWVLGRGAAAGGCSSAGRAPRDAASGEAAAPPPLPPALALLHCPSPAPTPLPAPQAISSLIYAGERVATDLAEVAGVAKLLVGKYRCVAAAVGGWGACDEAGGNGHRLLPRCRLDAFPARTHTRLLAATPASHRSSVYKESGFPHEVVSDLTSRKWQVCHTAGATPHAFCAQTCPHVPASTAHRARGPPSAGQRKPVQVPGGHGAHA